MTNKNKSYHYSKIGKAKFRLFLRLLAMDLTATEAASLIMDLFFKKRIKNCYQPLLLILQAQALIKQQPFIF